ncbi:MAG: sugar phosphate isomerase/epimerase [Fimbriimonadaceae bacterium]|nr:sugar phosphate isomerase/epimerase [Fimbriimonadaceae bacterium]
MKLGFIAHNHLEGIEADCRFAALHGYRGLEFNYWGDFANVTPEHIAAVATTLRSHGVQCSTLGIWGWNHISADAAERERAHAMLDRAIDYAVTLGAPVLITGGGRMVPGDLDANVAEYAKVMPRYLDRAAEKGLQVALYGFHGGSFLDTIEGYEKLWELLPNVGVKYDAANIDHAGQDYLQLLRDHAAQVYHVHIKDHLNHGGTVASQPAAGMGDIQFGKILAFLYEVDYQGYLTVEPHGPLWGREPLRSKMLALTKQHLAPYLLT